MIPESIRRAAFMALGGAALIGLVLLLRIDWSAGNRIAAAKALVDPRIDATRDLGTVLAQHPAVRDLTWEGDFGGDERLVCALATVERADALPEALTQEARRLTAMTPEWLAIAGDQAMTLRIVVLLGPDGRAASVDDVRCQELWVVFDPSKVDEYEEGLQRSAELVGSSTLSAYRLRRDGDRSLFNAGLHDPMLAGPGMAQSASAWLAGFVAWNGGGDATVAAGR